MGVSLRYSAPTIRDLGRVVATGTGVIGKIVKQRINLILIFRSTPQLAGLHYELYMERIGFEEGYALVNAASTATQIYKGIEPDERNDGPDGQIFWMHW